MRSTRGAWLHISGLASASLLLNALLIFVLTTVTGTLRAQSQQPFFDGTPALADKAVMEQAAHNIENYRKGDFNLTLVDAAGKPIAGKAVVAELEKHQFNFGTNLFGITALKDDDPLKAIAHQTILDIFNSVVVVNYWHNPQKNESYAELIKKDLTWAETHGLRTRFHAILYNDPKQIFVNHDYTTDQCWQLMEERIRYVAKATGDKAMEYDVINEMYSKLTWDKNKPDAFMKQVPQFPDLTDPQVVKRVFDLTRKHLPKAQLVGLEANHPSIHNPVYMEIIDYWKRSIAAGADVDVIGTQAHFYAKGLPYQQGAKGWGADAYTMSGISQALDTLRTLGKPIEITEFNGPSRNSKDSEKWRAQYWTMSEEENSAWQINFYRLAFSKPHIIGVTRWFHIDNYCGRGMDAGIITETGEKHRVYYDLKKLIKEEWHTRIAGQSAQGGQFAFRGFYGDYLIRAEGYKPAKVTLNAGRGNMTVQLRR